MIFLIISRAINCLLGKHQWDNAPGNVRDNDTGQLIARLYVCEHCGKLKMVEKK